MRGIVIRTLAASIAAAAALSPSPARAQDEPAPYPPRPRVFIAPAPPQRDVITWQQTLPNTQLLAGGVLTLGVGYGTSLVVAATSERPSDGFLYVPVVGPWMDLGTRDCRNIPCDVSEAGNRVLLVANGILQAGGVLQILGSFLLPETHTVTRVAEVPSGVHVRPTAGPGSVGLAAYGAF